jgi:hypothetical protein
MAANSASTHWESSMFDDFVTAVEAGIQCAPTALAQHGGRWYLYSPTTPEVGDDAPHVLVNEGGVLVALNNSGSQVLCTFALTGGHA